MPYEKLQPFILEIPLVWNTDLNSILLKGQEEGQLRIQGPTPRQGIPRPGNVIRLK